jgi:Tfp pilus assembly PilM family ATPase
MMGGAKGLAGSLASYPVAIDFGAGALKVLHVQAGEPLALVSAACLPTPDELLPDAGRRLAFQLDALPRLLKDFDLKTKRAVCAIPAAQAFCKHMQFQLEPGVTIPALVRSAVPGQLGCDPSALVYRHVEVGPIARTTRTEVICMAAGRELVERLMRAVKECRLEPVGMHIEYSATLRAFDSITRREEDRKLTSLYLDIGAGSTKVVIAHGRELVFARAIDMGGRHLDATLAKQLKVGLGEARAHRLAMAEIVGVKRPAKAEHANGSARPAREAIAIDRRHGAVPTGFTPNLAVEARIEFEPPTADLSEPLEILTDEIWMCLRYHESVFPDRRVDRAIFFGGEARHLGLCQHIARTLRLPAQVADPMASLARSGRESTPGVDFRQSQPGWAMTLGLCLSPTDL